MSLLVAYCCSTPREDAYDLLILSSKEARRWRWLPAGDTRQPQRKSGDVLVVCAAAGKEQRQLGVYFTTRGRRTDSNKCYSNFFSFLFSESTRAIELPKTLLSSKPLGAPIKGILINPGVGSSVQKPVYTEADVEMTVKDKGKVIFYKEANKEAYKKLDEEIRKKESIEREKELIR
ncbi:hypothetical protein LXL04_019954 [Taraxacum kok-saghyz]